MALGNADLNGCNFSVPTGSIFLPLYMKVGQEFRTYISFTCPGNSGTSEIRTKMLGVELVSVPAGTYRALVLERKQFVSGAKTVDEKIWLAKGLGTVKTESTSEMPFPAPFTPDGILRVVITTQLTSTNLILDDQNDDEDDCDCSDSTRGLKINYATGATTIYEDDIASTAYSPLHFRRIFKGNSEIDDGSLGAGWSHNYARRASFMSYASLGGPETIHLHRENGTTIQFSNNNGFWVSATDLKGKLTVVKQGAGIHTISYQNTNDEIELYDASGKLLSLLHLGGLKTTLAYDTEDRLSSVSDSFGRTLTFSYDSVGRITSVTPSNGHAASYMFGEEGQLDNVTLPDQKTRKYRYAVIREPSGGDIALRVKSVVDQSDVEFLNLNFDEKGRVKSRSYGPGVSAMTIDYSNPSSRTITDSLMTPRTATFAKILGRNRRVTLSSQCNECEDGGTALRVFDQYGNVIERTDFNGIKTKYEYDTARGLETSRTEAAGTALARTIKTKWHSNFRLAEAITEPLRNTTYTYDANGNLLKKTVQATSDSSGSSGGAAVGVPQISTYTYGTGGRILTVTGPRTDVVQKTEFNYDTLGNLIKIIDPVGQITELSRHDLDGRPGRIVMPDGVVYDYIFKPQGLLESITVTAESRSEVVTYSYDATGKVQTVSLPDQSIYSFSYDTAQRLKEVKDHIGNRVEYELDSQGNRTSEKLYGSDGIVAKQLARSFDSNGRLKQKIGGLQ